MQQRQTIIEIRPCTGGWQCYESPGAQPYWTGDTAKEDTLDYAIAPAKFEGEFRGLVFPLLRDNSKSGCSLFSESLAEKSFRHDNLPFFGGIAQLVERLVRNEKVRGSNPLTSSLRASSGRAKSAASAVGKAYRQPPH